MAILAALNSSTISRLKKTWEGLSNKHKATLEVLRKATEHTRNYAEYRAIIRSAVAPCLPFLGLYLTDITFCYDGNPAKRNSPLDPSLQLINFDRYQVSLFSSAACLSNLITNPPAPSPLTENREIRWRSTALPAILQSH